MVAGHVVGQLGKEQTIVLALTVPTLSSDFYPSKQKQKKSVSSLLGPQRPMCGLPSVSLGNGDAVIRISIQPRPMHQKLGLGPWQQHWSLVGDGSTKIVLLKQTSKTLIPLPLSFFNISQHTLLP